MEISCLLKTKKPKQLLSLIAIALDVDTIFHCTSSCRTATIQSGHEFFSIYEQTLDLDRMIRYIDPRSKELRERQWNFHLLKEVKFRAPSPLSDP